MLNTTQHIQHTIKPGNSVFIQVTKGQLTVNNISLNAGDGLGLTDIEVVQFYNGNDAEFLLFDMEKP